MNFQIYLISLIVSAAALAQGNYILVEEIAGPGVQFHFQRDYNSASFVLANQAFDWQTAANAGDHYVRQLPAPGYMLTNIQCDLSNGTASSVKFYTGGATPANTPTSTFAAGDDSVAIHLAAGDTVECRFYNQASQPVGARMVTTEQVFLSNGVTPDTSVTDAFGFNLSPGSPFSITPALGTNAGTFSQNLTPGTYVLSQPANTVPAAFANGTISCTCQPWPYYSSCVSTFVVDNAHSQVNLTLAAGEEVDCTVTNSRKPVCGDLIKNAGEQCDAGPNGNSVCSAQCTCITGIDNQGNCIVIIPPTPICGDGHKDSGEQCDAGAFGSSVCSSSCQCVYGVDNHGHCKPVPPPPPHCGDGHKDSGEQCDNGISNGHSLCSSTCTCIYGTDNHGKCRTVPPQCGDGIKDSCEECDLGCDNGKPGSACDSQCHTCAGGLDANGECTSSPSTTTLSALQPTAAQAARVSTGGCSSTGGSDLSLFATISLLLFALRIRRSSLRAK